MSDNLVLDLLRALRADIARLYERQAEHGTRLTRMETTLAGLRRDQASDAEARAENSVRLDHIRESLDRVEARLELSSAPSL